jgi:hypothetical protein
LDDVGFIRKAQDFLRVKPAFDSIQRSIEIKRNVYIFLWFDLMVDLTMCVLYIVSIEYGYLIDSMLVYKPYWLWMCLVVLSFFNVTSSLFRFIFSKHYLSQWANSVKLIDILTAWPMIFTLAIPNGQFIAIPTFLRGWLVVHHLQTLMLLKLDFSLTEDFSDRLTIQLIALGSGMAAMLFTGLCAFQVSELIFGGINYNAFDSLYYMVITFSTVRTL